MEKSVNPPFFCLVFRRAPEQKGVMLLHRGEKDLDLL